MQKTNLGSAANSSAYSMNVNRPTMPLISKKVFVEKRTSDPSSSASNSNRYPIPGFFEYRIKAKEYDPL
ncbi:MAG TPA: hypothetical protein VM368_05075 [Flavisolibacter sp.]|nr:hypothetical protein [Flavisolibacter sp.]